MMDKNGDGKLSEAEVKGPLKSDFNPLDKNKDGYLIESELKNAGPPRGSRN